MSLRFGLQHVLYYIRTEPLLMHVCRSLHNTYIVSLMYHHMHVNHVPSDNHICVGRYVISMCIIKHM